MLVFSIAKGFHRVSKNIPIGLTQKELDRLRAITILQETKDVGLVCDTFGISRATLYRWIKRFDPRDFSSLKEQSRRPKRLRRPRWDYKLVIAIKELREHYPRWGKDKIIVLLKNQGWETSASTVGRILKYLKARGDIIEPPRKSISVKRKVKRLYAVRKPKDYLQCHPGDLVQIDTLDIRPLPWIILKQFTARDVRLLGIIHTLVS